MYRAWRSALVVICFAVAVVLVGAPLAAWPQVVRLPAVLVPALALAVLVLRPWRWTESAWDALSVWVPAPRVIWSGAAALGLLLFWIVLTRFQSGEINGVDFTVYFDRPCFQTVLGRPLLVETADYQVFSHRSAFAHHAYWGMLPLCSLYAIGASPLWLLAISVVAVVAGAVHILRISQTLGVGGVLATVTALAFALNDNTARALNYGFHPEVLYAWFVPWMLDAGLRGKRRSFIVATLACVSVKEDAFMLLLAASVTLGLHRWDRMNRLDRAVFTLAPVALGLANLGIYYGYVVPALTDDGRLMYGHFWANYGPTPLKALAGMMAHPWQLLMETLTSGFFQTVILPHLFLPLIGWRWMVGVVPIVVIYSASADEQLRRFGIYYAIVLVPFLVIGASTGASTVARWLVPQPRRASFAAAALVLLGALLVGSGNRGYSLRPWRGETVAVADALARLAGEPIVLVQSGLYPHASYDARVQLLTPETLLSPQHAGAAVLIAPKAGAYPFQPGDLDGLGLHPMFELPAGVLAVRAPAIPRHPMRKDGHQRHHRSDHP